MTKVLTQRRAKVDATNMWKICLKNLFSRGGWVEVEESVEGINDNGKNKINYSKLKEKNFFNIKHFYSKVIILSSFRSGSTKALQ